MLERQRAVTVTVATTATATATAEQQQQRCTYRANPVEERVFCWTNLFFRWTRNELVNPPGEPFSAVETPEPMTFRELLMAEETKDLQGKCRCFCDPVF